MQQQQLQAQAHPPTNKRCYGTAVMMYVFDMPCSAVLVIHCAAAADSVLKYCMCAGPHTLPPCLAAGVHAMTAAQFLYCCPGVPHTSSCSVLRRGR
jgi:hypothetical protein